jgi:hypothetical protein
MSEPLYKDLTFSEPFLGGGITLQWSRRAPIDGSTWEPRTLTLELHEWIWLYSVLGSAIQRAEERGVPK